MKHRLLLISHVFPPLVAGGAPRMGQFARLLPDFGWDVTVVTAKHGSSGLDRATAHHVHDRATVIETWSPTSAISTRGKPVAKTGVRGLIRRALRAGVMTVMFPDREILWVPSAIAAARKALRETPHHAVLATYGPGSNFIVGRAVAHEFHLPLVVDFRDLWSTLPMDVFTTPAHRRAARALERHVVRKASRVIAVAPHMASELARVHEIDAARAVSITNGFDPADVPRVRDGRTVGAPFRLMYVGSVNAHYDLNCLWTAVRELAAAGTISPETFRLEFVGNLSINDVKAQGLEDLVEVSPFVPHDQVFDAMGRADALLMAETPGYYAKFSYAAKVFDYILTGKPVVALVEAGGNSATLLEAAGVLYRAEPGDARAVRSALERVLSLRGASPRVVDATTRPFRDFDRRVLVERLASVLRDVVRTEPTGLW